MVRIQVPLLLVSFSILLNRAHCSSSSISLYRKQAYQQPCNTSSIWQPLPQNYVDAGTESHLQDLSKSVGLNNEGRLDNALGRIWGDDFQCGIGATDCSSPSCFELQDQDDPPWTYLAAVTFQNLNEMFNVIFTGIGLGQSDFSDLTDDLADNFFHWKDPVYIGEEIALWFGTAIGIVCGFGAGKDILSIPTLVRGIGALTSAGAEQTAQSLQPVVGANREVGIRQLKDAALVFSEAVRNSTEIWATSTFQGLSDVTSKTILDYVQGGAFVDNALIPSSAEVELFFKAVLVANAINSPWRTQPIYLVATTADLSGLGNYPVYPSWRSATSGRTFVPYWFHGNEQQQPPGLNLLNQTQYGILPSQITESSARAWEYAGNNYTPQIAQQRLQDALGSDGTLTPFQDGPGWEGIFTLPVCDVGPHAEWLVPYGGDLLPCCCGTDCKDTRAFVEAANLNNSDSFLNMCRNQLKGSDLDFDDIDYGIEGGSSAAQFWRHLGKGGKAGFVIGVVIAGVVFWVVLVSFCNCCFRRCRRKNPRASWKYVV